MRPAVLFILLFCFACLSLCSYALISFFTEYRISTMNSDTKIGLITVAILIPVFMLAIYSVIKNELKLYKRWKSFENAWVKTEGMVIGKWRENTFQVDNLGGLDYYIAVQYNGNKKVKSQVTSGIFYKIKVGGKIKLRFVRFKSEVCEIIKI